MSTKAPECWLNVFPLDIHNIAERSRTFEAEGWDGIGIGDSQCLCQDPFLLIALGFAATRRLRMVVAVSNVFTRHPSVLANLAATLQDQSQGRFVLGIGRGDSPFSHLGIAPGSFEHYERSIRKLQGYLKGEVVPFDPKDIRDGSAPISKITLGQIPPGTELKWLDRDIPKPALDVHTGGPQTLRMAARYAERITLVVGAAPERIRWAVDLIHRSCEEFGRDPKEINIGALLSVVPHPDRTRARQLGAGHQAASMRATAILGHYSGPYSDADRDEIARVISAYDMNNHVGGHTPQAGILSQDFTDRHFVVGPPEECVAQIREIVSLGVDRLHIATSSTHDALRGASEAEIEESKTVHRLLVEEVVRPLKAGAAAV
jgi:5,10-methylenetetrahydromethanopterin reductase